MDGTDRSQRSLEKQVACSLRRAAAASSGLQQWFHEGAPHTPLRRTPTFTGAMP